MHKYIYIITVCYFFQFMKSQIVIQLNNKYKFELTLDISTNKSVFKTSVDLEDNRSKFPWMSKHYLKNSLLFNEYLAEESIMTDINNKTYTFPLYYSRDNSASIGVNPSFNNESIINSIYNKGLISKKAFALELYYHNNTNNYLYLGNIPSSKIKHYQHLTTPRIEDIRSSNGDEYWAFRIHALGLNNEKLKIDSTFFISLAHESLVLNKKIYSWIRNITLKEYILNGTCVESTGNWVNIKCNNNIVDYLPPLQFIVSEKPLQMFEIKFITEFDKHLSFTYNRILDQRPYIFINKNLFYGKIIQFDYESNEISFYIPKKYAIYDAIVLTKKMLFINVLLLVFSGAYLIFSFFSEKTIIII